MNRAWIVCEHDVKYNGYFYEYRLINYKKLWNRMVSCANGIRRSNCFRFRVRLNLIETKSIQNERQELWWEFRLCFLFFEINFERQWTLRWKEKGGASSYLFSLYRLRWLCRQVVNTWTVGAMLPKWFIRYSRLHWRGIDPFITHFRFAAWIDRQAVRVLREKTWALLMM